MPNSILNEIHQERCKVATELNEMIATFKGNGQFENAEQEEKFTKLNEAYDSLGKKIDEHMNVDSVRQKLAEIEAQPMPKDTPLSSRRSRWQLEDHEAKVGRAVTAFFREPFLRSPEDEQIMSEVGLNPGSTQIEINLANDQWLQTVQHEFLNNPSTANIRTLEGVRNAPLTTGTASTGGETIPAELFVRDLEMNMLWFSGMRQVAETITTSGGETMRWPTFDDTGNAGRIVAESTAADDNAGGGTSGDGGPNPTFANVQWGAHKYTSDTILIPHELIEDNQVDLVPKLAAALGERIARITNTHFTTGAGTTLPFGIVGANTSNISQGVAIATAAAFDSDDLIDLQHSVDVAYRQNGRFMMADSTVALIRKFKRNDEVNSPAWQPSMQLGVPDMIFGSPITVNNDMPALTATNDAIVYGNLSAYKIRRVRGVRFYRLDEKYREKDQTGIVAFLREDGNVLGAGTDQIKFLHVTA